MSESASTKKANYQTIGLILGPILAILVTIFFRVDTVPIEATFVAAVAVLMAIWWATEATHPAVTAFLPLVLFPILGINDMSATANSYAHPIIYLFLGGFVMAIMVERSGLHLRAALTVFDFSGVKSKSLVGGFMLAAALVSMWISNTSTTLMMLPVAMSVVHVVRDTMKDINETEIRNFEYAIFLGLAYGATMGGVATLVGTPPNAFLAGFMADNYNIEIDFARWMIVGVPITIVMLPLTWFLLTHILFPTNFTASESTKRHIQSKQDELGKMSVFEKRACILFLLLILGWIFRKPFMSLTGFTGITDAGVAMTMAVLAFLIPCGEKKENLMTWDAAKRIPWGVLILFGGGLALASGMTATGLTQWLGQQLAPLGNLHIAILVISACALVIFLTELTSNLATTATFLPVMAAIAVETGNDPLIFAIPVTLAASFAFMLPVATPPNAIIFSSGRVSIPQMVRSGFVLNMISVVVLTLFAIFLVPKVF
jgi:sodium-dependent dicarboxylate transporter 2/3/5